VEINLSENKIESIDENIFQTNLKLKRVDLQYSQIKALNPVIFKYLNYLKEVDFEYNRCASQGFGCENCTIDHEELNSKLTPCFINCIEDKECTAKSKTWVKELSCKFYESDLRVVLPKFKFCQISGIDFSFESFDNNFTFTGPENKLKQTTAVEIKQSPKFDFVPVEIIQQFRSLQGLKITFSRIEILRENLFTLQFENITYLDLSSNGIQQVFEAFKHLPELRWIILANNSIETLIYRVFKNNKKLEVIDLQDNKIKMINVKLFLNLADLQVLNLQENECANNLLYREDINEKSNHLLSKCHKNCQDDRKCFLLSNDDEVRIENRTISCNYNGVDWDQKTTCFVTEERFKMPNNDSIISYKFSGTEDKKENATAVYFELSLTVNFVPFEIFENFPKLDSIAFTKSEIPMIKSNLFGGQNFEQIKELRLNEDKIRVIENGAFVDLKNLEKIDLTNNKIRSINKETFAQNKKLREAILTGNEIKLIHPKAFLNQKYVFVVMFGNKCFGDETFNIAEDLKHCYNNWNKAYEIIEEGKHLCNQENWIFIKKINNFLEKSACPEHQIASGFSYGGQIVEGRKYPWIGALLRYGKVICGSNLS
jgi:Leucine-rich repeat (LRR) protein